MKSIVELSREYVIPGFEDCIMSIDEWSAGNLQNKKGIKPQCPRCGGWSLDHYSPRGDSRIYRACKGCGFWQELYGVPYQCTLKGHLCNSTTMHAQFFMPWEDKNFCTDCGKELLPMMTLWQQLQKKK